MHRRSFLITTGSAVGALTLPAGKAKAGWGPATNNQRQGAYARNIWVKNGLPSEQMMNGRLRFINILHQGNPNPQNWERSFVEATRWYEQQNVTSLAGGNNNFFRISGLSNTRHAILGWCFYYGYGSPKLTEWNYLVIHTITNQVVGYARKSRTFASIGKNPNNFETYYIGTRKTASSRVRTQLWKHGGDAYSAGVCFWNN